MAVLFSSVSQNWTASGWRTVDSSSYLKSETSFQVATTSYVSSSNFITNAITVEGILLRVRYTATSPSGTFSVQLYNASSSVAVSTVTCNVSDIPNNANLDGGWMYFKFGSSVTLLNATAYSIRILSSVSNMVYVYRDAVANNWSRGLVTTTTASVVNGDDIIICGNITAAATTSVNTITYDYTGANSWGSLEIGGYGKLIGENSASKNYVLTVNSSGVFRVSQNGIAEFSTTSSRLPSTSTFTLTITCATNASNFIDIRNFGTFRAFGATKTRKAKLAADLSIGGTSITTDVSTGWKTGDNIIIAGTEGTLQQQLRVLASDAVGTTVAITSSTYATKGTAPTVADVINVTSNFKVQASSQTLAGYFSTQQSSIIDVDNIEFKYFGASSTQGIILNTNPATLGYGNVKDCSISYINTNGTGIVGSTTSNGVTIDGCVGYPNINTGSCFQISSAGDVYNTYLINCVAIGIGQYGCSATMSPTVTFQNNTVANGSTVQAMQILSRDGNGGGIIDNIKCYRTTAAISFGLGSTAYVSYKTSITNIYSWRNSIGIYFNYSNDLTIDGLTTFGNITTNIYLSFSDNIKIINGDIQGGVTSVAANGITLYGYKSNILFERCNIGTTTTHTTGDININDALGNYLTFNNCSFGSTSLIVNQTRLTFKSQIAFQRFNGSAGSNRVYKKYGTVFSDTTIYDTSPSSQRLTPSSASYKLQSSSFQISVASGKTSTFSIKVRKSVAGDGTAYNGNQPRLILQSNPSAGSTYNSDIVCATASAVAGTWETLSYTLPTAVTDNVAMQFYVDCDGTLGWINIDTVVTSPSTNLLSNYINGEPIQFGNNTEISSTFVSS